MYLFGFISVSQRNLEYAAVNHVLFCYAIMILQLVNFILCLYIPNALFCWYFERGSVCVYFQLAVGICETCKRLVCVSGVGMIPCISTIFYL